MRDDGTEAKRENILRQIEELNEALTDQTFETLKGNVDKAWTMRTKAQIDLLQSKLQTISESDDQ